LGIGNNSLILVIASLIILPISFNYAEGEIPFWFKHIANWWAEDQLSDMQFVQVTEYLIKKELLPITSSISSSPSSGVASLPDWIRNTADWWGMDQVSDSDFMSAIEWLVVNEQVHESSQTEKSLLNYFNIEKKSVSNGLEVTWNPTNEQKHTVTGGTIDNANEIFDSGLLTNQPFTFVFRNEGPHPYFCMIHPWESATLSISSAELAHIEQVEQVQDGSFGFMGDRSMLDNPPQTPTEEAEEIVGTYNSISLGYAMMNNEDGKMLLDFIYDIFQKHRDAFSEDDIRYLKFADLSEPDWGVFDPLLEKAGIKIEFYQGMASISKEIFKNKIPIMESFRDETIQKIRELDIEEAEKESLISEINRITESNKNELAYVAATFIQPFEEKAKEAEKEEQIVSEILGDSSSNGGGCLIATATFGSELAPQVQQLREIRDNSLLQTESGSAFMESFNQFYYSFSPGIADLERENPVFKEIVKLAITPLLTSLSLLNYVDIDSESEVLGYGISLIILNVGMYFVLPAVVIHRLRKFV